MWWSFTTVYDNTILLRGIQLTIVQRYWGSTVKIMFSYQICTFYEANTVHRCGAPELAFGNNCHKNFFWDNISRHAIFIQILSFIAVKNIVEKKQNFFSFGRIFSPKFADHPCWVLATVNIIMWLMSVARCLHGGLSYFESLWNTVEQFFCTENKF
jgi:hypothetical protein